MTDTSAAPIGSALRRLYFLRFAFAIVWSGVLFGSAGSPGALLTVLLVLYPLADAVAVFWQIRNEGPAQSSRLPEGINVAVSAIAAIALGIASASSVAAALVVWGVWAVVSGVVQLIVALLRRSLGGQIPLIVSGAISVLAGIAFAAQGIQGTGTVLGVGGYAVIGGIFFLIAAIRLSIVLRKAA